MGAVARNASLYYTEYSPIAQNEISCTDRQDSMWGDLHSDTALQEDRMSGFVILRRRTSPELTCNCTRAASPAYKIAELNESY